MKPPTVFLGEMTSPEVEAFLGAGHDTVIVPVGSTEQHGPHGPLLTDAIVPTEVARRVAHLAGMPGAQASGNPSAARLRDQVTAADLSPDGRTLRYVE